MSKTKCKDKNEPNKVKDSHKYQCKKCGASSKKEDKLCKPRKIKADA